MCRPSIWFSASGRRRRLAESRAFQSRWTPPEILIVRRFARGLLPKVRAAYFIGIVLLRAPFTRVCMDRKRGGFCSSVGFHARGSNVFPASICMGSGASTPSAFLSSVCFDSPGLRRRSTFWTCFFNACFAARKPLAPNEAVNGEDPIFLTWNGVPCVPNVESTFPN